MSGSMMGTRRAATEVVRRRVMRHLSRAALPPGSRLVVAVSGGPDSMALLDALAAVAPGADVALVVAHCHHGIRGDDATRDAAFVEQAARRYGLPFHDTKVDAPAFARDAGLSLEDAARRLRRRFLQGVRLETGSHAVALGHTRDDQAETLLLNLLRGAGPRGLGAMPEFGPDFLVRPLIRVRRAAVLAYLAERGIDFRIDESNGDLSFRRNRVRHELLPLIEGRFNPGIVESLTRQSGLFREIDRLVRRLGTALVRDPSVATAIPGGMRLRVGRLLGEPAATRRAALRAAVRKVAGTLEGWQRSHFDAIRKLLSSESPARLDLPGGLRAERRGPVLDIRKEGAAAPVADLPPPPGVTPVPLRHGHEIPWGNGRLRVTILEVSPTAGSDAAGSAGREASGSAGHRLPGTGLRSAWFDADRLPVALALRAPGPGDRIDLFGTGGRKKLSDLFIDLKVPRSLRASRPVVSSADAGGEIVWVAGAARSRHAPVTAETRRIAHLEWFGDWK